MEEEQSRRNEAGASGLSSTAPTPYPKVLKGHAEEVESVAFSPDGAKIVSGSCDESIKIWNALSGCCESSFTGHGDWVYSVAYSPDGNDIVSGSRDNTIRIWNGKSGECKAVLEGQKSTFTAVAYSPDGESLACGSFDGTIRIAKVGTKEFTTVLNGHEGWVFSVSYAPHGKSIASGGVDKTIRIWDSVSGESTAILEGHRDQVNCVAFSPGGENVVSCSRDLTIRIWNAMSAECTAILEGHGGWITAVAYSPDGESVLSGSHDRTVRIWNALSGECMVILNGHEDAVRAVAFSPDGETVMSCSNDSTICLWNASSGESTTILRGHKDLASSVGYSPSGENVVSGGDGKTICLWNSSSGQVTSILRGHEELVTSAVYLPNGESVVSSSRDHTVRVWDVVSGECEAILEGHEKAVKFVACSSNGESIVSASADNTVRIWNTASGHCTSILEGHEDQVNSVAFSPDGEGVASCSRDRTIHIWNPSSGACKAVLEGHEDEVNSVVYSPDGERIISGSKDHTVCLWDVSSGERTTVARGHEDGVNSVACSPDGECLASCSDDSTVRIWSAFSGECKAILKGHEQSVFSVAYSPGGESIVSSSDDKTIRIWHLSTHYSLQGFRLFSRAKTGLPMSPIALNFFLLMDLEHAKGDRLYNWDRFQLFSNEAMKYPLSIDFRARVVSEWERPGLGRLAGDGALFHNPLHVAVVRGGDTAAAAVHRMLQASPLEAITTRHGPLSPDDSSGIPSSRMSLLRRALEVESADNVKTILSVLAELLTVPEDPSVDHDAREFVKDGTSRLAVFKGDTYELPMSPHIGDHVPIEEVCVVAEKYPELFLQFVEELKVVPTYPIVRGHSMAMKMYERDHILAGSFERTPNPASPNPSVESSSHLPFWNDARIRQLTKSPLAIALDLFRLSWIAPRIDSYQTPLAVAPGLVPVKGIAGIDSPFLVSVVDAAAKLRQLDVFKNEVVQHVVEFKWQTFVRYMFYLDASLFGLLFAIFLSNSLLFNNYGQEVNGVPVVVGWILTSLSYCLIAYFFYVELTQFNYSRRNKGGILRGYLLDGWNVLDLVNLIMLAATVCAQFGVLPLLSRTNDDVGEWIRLADILAAASMPTMAAQALYYLRGPQQSGALVRMTMNILEGIRVFCGILLVFVVAFAGGFMLLFVPEKERIQSYGHEDGNELVFPGAYFRFDMAMLAVFGMLVGDINVADMMLSTSPGLAVFLLVLFVFVTGIVLLNMLIAVMGDLYDEVQENAMAQATFSRARLVLEYEKRMIRIFWKDDVCFPKWIQVLKRGTIGDSAAASSKRTWEGRANAIRKPVLNRMQELQSSLGMKVGAVEDRMKETMRECEEKLGKKMGSIEAKVGLMETRMRLITQEKIGTMEAKMNRKISAVERKLDDILEILRKQREDEEEGEEEEKAE